MILGRREFWTMLTPWWNTWLNMCSNFSLGVKKAVSCNLPIFFLAIFHCSWVLYYNLWMASQTWWTWVWVNSGRWWWTGRLGVLWFMGSQRVGHDWATELNWTDTYKPSKEKAASQSMQSRNERPYCIFIPGGCFLTMAFQCHSRVQVRETQSMFP